MKEKMKKVASKAEATKEEKRVCLSFFIFGNRKKKRIISYYDILCHDFTLLNPLDSLWNIGP